MRDYSNYHNTNTNEKLSHDGLLLLEHSLNGFEGYDVVINESNSSRVLIYQKHDADSETKQVIGQIADIERGNVLKQGELNWLIITLPEDNKIYRKAEMKLCNSTFPIQTNKTSVLVGTDDFGRPDFETVETITHEPCIVEPRYFFKGMVDQMTNPQDSLAVTLKYQESDSLQENHEFDMYKSKYKITFIDYSKVINGKGVITVTGERVIKDGGI
jgi:hypothetical protein